MRSCAWSVYGWIVAVCLLVPNFVQAAPFQLLLDQAQVRVQLEGQSESVLLGTRQLPWRWDYEFNQQNGIAHFNFQIQLSEDQWQNLQTNEAGLGLFGIQIGSRYRFRFNNSTWTEVGWQETTQYRARPRWHLIPRSHLLGQSVNTLEIEVRFAASSDSGLSKIELGEVQSLLSKYQHESNFRYFSTLFAGVSSMLIGLLAFSMWWASRERFFMLTGLAEIMFALRQTGIFIDYPPLPTWVWNAMHGQFYAAYVGLICLASLRLSQQPAPRMVRLIYLFLGSSLPLLWVGHWLGEYRAYLMCLVMMLLLTFSCVIRISIETWRTSNTNTNPNTRLFTFGAWIALLLGLYDFVLVSAASTGLGYVRFGVFSSVLFNLSLAVIIVRRYQTASRDLDISQLAAKSEGEKATLVERQRIMSDIHDTVGSQLVSVLGMIKSGASHAKLESETSDALEDLRIAIDAIQPVNGSLTAVLATLRHRLEPRIEAHGLVLHWQVQALPRLKHMSPQIVQHVQRMILEVITNTLKHARASSITLSAHAQACADDVGRTEIQICIADDGVGLGHRLDKTQGQGLNNIRMRAALIKASVRFDAAAASKGTTVTLTLPVHP